jgi:hypothetical protein
MISFEVIGVSTRAGKQTGSGCEPAEPITFRQNPIRLEAKSPELQKTRIAGQRSRGLAPFWIVMGCKSWQSDGYQTFLLRRNMTL